MQRIRRVEIWLFKRFRVLHPLNRLSHFHKVECFCFRQQALKSGESKNMALVFNVDKELPKEAKEITLRLHFV